MGHHRLQSLRPLQVCRPSSRRSKRPSRRSCRSVHVDHPPVLTSQFSQPSLPSPAGKDATGAFFGLHRHEVLLRPQYKRLQIGTVHGQTEHIKPPSPGDLSEVPYAEPTWLSRGYHSPYYTESHRRFQKATRKFFMEIIKPEVDRCEESGKRISQEVVDKMA